MHSLPVSNGGETQVDQIDTETGAGRGPPL